MQSVQVAHHQATQSRRRLCVDAVVIVESARCAVHIIPRQYLYSEVDQHIAVMVKLDCVVNLRISNHRHRSWKHCGEFQCQTYVSMFYHIKMVVIA